MDLPCIVEYVRFRKDDGFAILSCSLNAFSSKYTVEQEDVIIANFNEKDRSSFTVTLGMLGASENPQGKQYIFVGDFTKHPRFGNQFKAEFYYEDEPTNEDSLRICLMELPHIKDARVRDILNTFGVDETLRILKEEPRLLLRISGINEARLPFIEKAWKSKQHLRELYMWLSQYGISAKIGEKAYKNWQEKSISILEENPYRLVEIKGVGFKMADLMAHKILKDVPMAYRLKACIHFVLTEDVFKNGNICTPYVTLKNSVAKLIVDCDRERPNSPNINEYFKMIPQCIKNNLDVFTPIKNMDKNNESYVYLRSIWKKEKYIAEELYKRKSAHKGNRFDCNEHNLDEAQKDVSNFSGREIVLDDCQREAIKSAFKNKITVITGGGGTGKSTICRCICHLASENKMSMRMMSPTGKASQVLSEKTGAGASTIHRSLRLHPDSQYPRENISEDMIIVDEISMVGIDTMFAIMFAMEGNLWGNIILVGDSNQLPSVSPGSFLADIIESGCANVVKLDKIHRQDENSYISVVANDISNCKEAVIPKEATDIKWHGNPSIDDLKSDVRKYIKEHNGMDGLQILAPMYKGSMGINVINESVQELMAKFNNASERYLQKGFAKFHFGDRVIQTENNYDKQIFNGDIGMIVDLGRKVINPEETDKEEDFIDVDFYGDIIMFVGDEIDSLKLAWCISVHKYQGSQSKNIAFVMMEQARIMMSKELVYTAFTRAENNLDIYGHINMLRLAPTKSVIRTRHTNLNTIIKGLRENQKLFDIMENKENEENEENKG